MKAAHEADLVWRFQRAEEELGVPSAPEDSGTSVAEAIVNARQRARRVDRVLARLRRKPVSLARVLALRYGDAVGGQAEEVRAVLRENAAVAETTAEAATWFEHAYGEPPRAHSHDVRRWLADACGRIRAREATTVDREAIDEVLSAAERVVREAENAYEAAAEGRPEWRVNRMEKKLKAFYTVAELAPALGMSRWTVRRWLDRKGVPYELCRRRGGTRGGRIVVMVSDFRRSAPSWFASVREELEG